VIPFSIRQIARITGGTPDLVADQAGASIAARAAIRAMAAGKRAYAVLGRMAGLGERSRERHERAGVVAARSGLAGIIAVGDEAAPILAGADVVLVQASRAAGLRTVALALTEQEASS
jgi:UDP-N-acetylmuramyl pentapeptide synthase